MINTFLLILTLSTHTGFEPLNLTIDVRRGLGVRGEVCIEIDGPFFYSLSCWNAEEQFKLNSRKYFGLPSGEYVVRGILQGRYVGKVERLEVACSERGNESIRSRCN